MKIFTTILILSLLNTETIYQFKISTNISDWQIVDDVVMGGQSKGSFSISEEGFGVFSGVVSTENNGGFSSVRYKPEELNSPQFEKFVIRFKGDGKKYQFRIKSSSNDFYSYVSNFSSNKEWQIIEIPVVEMYPSFRGYKLNQPNYNGHKLGEIGFLIGNKLNEGFRLEIDWIKTK